MEVQAATLDALNAYWQTFFGCAMPQQRDLPQTLVVPHVGLGTYHGIFLFRRQHTLMVSVPPAVVGSHAMHLATLTVADVADPATLITRVGLPIERLIGPACIGYADAHTFQP